MLVCVYVDNVLVMSPFNHPDLHGFCVTTCVSVHTCGLFQINNIIPAGRHVNHHTLENSFFVELTATSLAPAHILCLVYGL